MSLDEHESKPVLEDFDTEIDDIAQEANGNILKEDEDKKEEEYHDSDESEESEESLPNQGSHRRRRRSQSVAANKRIHDAFQHDQEDYGGEDYQPTAKRRLRNRVASDEDEPFVASASEEDLSDTDDSLVQSARTRRSLRQGTRRSTRLRTQRHDEDSDEEIHRPTLRERTSRVNYSVPLSFPPVEDQEGEGASFNQSRNRKTHSEVAVANLLRNQVSSFMPYIDSSGSESESDSTRVKRSSAKTVKALTDSTGAGGPPNYGRVKEKSDLADSDPLGVDSSLSFESVGGLDNHVNQLKEMIMLPLLYPEIFQTFNMQPPRGVLFHGPPGTGKTLLARALAAACSSEDKKVSFYMRKGADCLSKWVGEAERQLRLLFEEAKSTQPSIIFFDEIDGLAPVRSSKQEQIHASIVSTLLALMDGMDGRGQVIIIGATNRPDAVDPALRRPGRFDREFYFPLPDREARKKIIQIHTRSWKVPTPEWLCDLLAERSKGYGGADLRALCTEAALNSIKRTYPQLYRSSKRLQFDPNTIQVKVKDFALSMKRIIPSTARSSLAFNKPLPAEVKPLLEDTLDRILSYLGRNMPIPPKVNILEEVMFDDPGEDNFDYQQQLEQFEKLRIYKPRLLICGRKGLGQVSLGPAILQFYEGVHVQSFDMSALLQDSTQSIETSIIQLFTEVRRHTPSVIYIPDVDSWLNVLPPSASTTFSSLLERLDFSDQVLFLALSGSPRKELHPQLKEWFPKQSVVELQYPSRKNIEKFFQPIIDLISTSPQKLPGGLPRKRRILPELPLAPTPAPVTGVKTNLKQTKQADMRLLNKLKVKLNALLSNLRTRYRKFKKPLIDYNDIFCVDPETGHSYRKREECNFELVDEEVRKIDTNQKFSMMSLEEVEKRVWDNCYWTPKDFVRDIKLILRDALRLGDNETVKRAQEMYANVLLGLEDMDDEQFSQKCERMAIREEERRKLRENKLRKHLDATKATMQLPEDQQEQHVESNAEIDDSTEQPSDMLMETLTNMPIDNLSSKNEVREDQFKDVYLQPSIMSVPNSFIEKVDEDRVSPENISENGRQPDEDTLKNGISSFTDRSKSVGITEQNNNVMHGEKADFENQVEEEKPPELLLDERKLMNLKDLFLEISRDLTVEELVHLHASLYKIIWDTKSVWDRNSVIDKCATALKELTDDGDGLEFDT
ncbi:ATPase with bromodomain protein [Schizosaccharomyces cryophilus OY26]|uniref:ATPase with bromodomain protein n=1 Tax=Schizosaccharomyces cryophilus (strain OY26 / ATCC MYA-4695 / CBS 11777 / NBRC 106824 / NRRL Y48691) TaxID=653667 RepID=S9W0H8_SCHCR|nr:ATPase with bromodomain protein [Schizosaccharomyces cryophilus OY26]EPY53323.1 ATPase with bromodomain protein [Schizosaccharomyces cryophilus OY26]